MGFSQYNELDNINRGTYESELQLAADSWAHNVIMEAYSPRNSNSDYLKAHTDNMNRSTAQLQFELDNALMTNPYDGSKRNK